MVCVDPEGLAGWPLPGFWSKCCQQRTARGQENEPLREVRLLLGTEVGQGTLRDEVRRGGINRQTRGKRCLQR